MLGWLEKTIKMYVRFLILVFLTCQLSFGLQSYSSQEALRVFELIDKIQQEQMEKGSDEVRHVVVTESELNSYIGYRIEHENEEVMKELKLKLFEQNRIEAKVVVDLRGQDLPRFLRPEMTFFLEGELEVSDGLVRLDVKELFLENQRLQPAILDLVIFIGSKIQNMEPTSMEDWYELPFGIKNIKTERGCATFYY
jgi:hypothetical protein